MFIRGQLTKEQELKKMKRDLKGKNTKDKFKSLIESVTQKLHKITELDHFLKPDQKTVIGRLIDELSDQTVTTSSDKILLDMIECSEDISTLLEDMKLNQNPSTYEKRLDNALDFIGSYGTKRYSSTVSFYQDKSSRLEDQIKSISKDIQYKSSKMNHKIRKDSDEIIFLEKTNLDLFKKSEEHPKGSFQFKAIANEMVSHDQNIEMIKSGITLLTKNVHSMMLLGKLFEQLAIHEEYYKHLKLNGYTQRLIRKLYRKPDELDVMENTLDLAEVLVNIKEEIGEAESIIKPAKRMILEEEDNQASDDVMSKYKNMSK